MDFKTKIAAIESWGEQLRHAARNGLAWPEFEILKEKPQGEKMSYRQELEKAKSALLANPEQEFALEWYQVKIGNEIRLFDLKQQLDKEGFSFSVGESRLKRSPYPQEPLAAPPAYCGFYTHFNYGIYDFVYYGLFENLFGVQSEDIKYLGKTHKISEIGPKIIDHFGLNTILRELGVAIGSSQDSHK